ncbi:Uncharacterized protein HKD37_15G042281 [Glycine soja]
MVGSKPLLEEAEEGKAKEEKEAQPVIYSYSFFHQIFALASMYSAMLLSGWTSKDEDGAMQEEKVTLSMSMSMSMNRGMMVHCNNNNNVNNTNNVCNCKHSPSATLDLLILLLVLFSGAFLLSSYLCYIFNSLSLLLPSVPLSYLLPFLLFFALSLATADFCCGARSRRCQRQGCKGLKKAMEFDLQIQRFGSSVPSSAEIDKLPWKGGTEANPDYDCLRSELRKMAPPNGRALLLFRAPCGCPVAKLEASGPKKAKRHKR